jgi:hypothetical protein
LQGGREGFPKEIIVHFDLLLIGFS